MKRTIEISEIIKLYLDGTSTTEISKLANISPRYVNLILKKNDVERRPIGHWKRRYTLNEDYFKKWSNTMAYILGFFVADGFVGKNLQQIGFAQKERFLLEQIRNELGSNQPIYQNKKTGVYMLHINSMVMRKDIIEIHNINPHKSLDVEFPRIPVPYLHHFIRGYFDGDGSVDFRSYTVSFVGGSLNFMVTLKEVFEQYGFIPYLKDNGKHFRVIISGRKSISLFSNWIYKDKNLFLERKYKLFQQEKINLENLHDAKHKTSKKEVNQRKAMFLEKYIEYKCLNHACDDIGISQTTFQRWLKNDNDFNEKLHKIKMGEDN